MDILKNVVLDGKNRFFRLPNGVLVKCKKFPHGRVARKAKRYNISLELADILVNLLSSWGTRRHLFKKKDGSFFDPYALCGLLRGGVKVTGELSSAAKASIFRCKCLTEDVRQLRTKLIDNPGRGELEFCEIANLTHRAFVRQWPFVYCDGTNKQVFFVDFAFLSKNKKRGLVVEIDGPNHKGKLQSAWDGWRTEWLEKIGLRVIRFDSHAVLTAADEVERILREKLDEFYRLNTKRRSGKRRSRHGSKRKTKQREAEFASWQEKLSKRDRK